MANTCYNKTPPAITFEITFYATLTVSRHLTIALHHFRDPFPPQIKYIYKSNGTVKEYGSERKGTEKTMPSPAAA